MGSDNLEELQKRENEIYEEIKKWKLTDKQYKLLTELIDVNIEIEKFCNV